MFLDLKQCCHSTAKAERSSFTILLHDLAIDGDVQVNIFEIITLKRGPLLVMVWLAQAVVNWVATVEETFENPRIMTLFFLNGEETCQITFLKYIAVDNVYYILSKN